MNEPIIGFRSVACMSGSWVSPVYLKQEWNEGIITATCQYHDAPQKECTCGMYASHLVADAIWRWEYDHFRAPMAICAVMGWGENSLIHDDIWRTRHVKIIAVLENEKRKEIAELAGKKFNVGVFPLENFLRFSFEWGNIRDKSGIRKGEKEVLRQMSARAYDILLNFDPRANFVPQSIPLIERITELSNTFLPKENTVRNWQGYLALVKREKRKGYWDF